MSSSALMAPPLVNLDEFERRLRMAGAPIGQQEDPLDELARLVGLDAEDTHRSDALFDRAPKAAALRLPQARLLRVEDSKPEENDSDSLGDAEPEAMAQASLRGSLAEDAAAEAAQQDELLHAEHSGAVDHDDDAPAMPPAPAPRRSGRTALTMGVLVAIGAVAGLAAIWVVKGTPGLQKAPPVIMAADGPTKVQPPSQDTIASPSDSASVLLKDQTGKPGPVNIVSNVEQPVDLQQQANPPAAPAASAAAPVASPTAPTAAAAPAPAPPPAAAPSAAAPPPSLAVTSVGPTTAPPAAPSPFPEPKHVKTVSVRPDGSLISSGSEPAAGAAATPAPADSAPSASTPQPANPPVPRARPSFDGAASGAAQPATPKLDLPTKLSGKSTARVPTAKIDTTVTTPPPDQAPDAPQPGVPDLLQKVARAVTGQPQQQVAAAEPAPTATTPTAPGAAGGAFAVQLAAPPSEKEAQSVSARLQAKYAAELGGLQPSIRQAESNGRAIWRIRLSGLSKAEAVSLCQKLKASGGERACFIAKD